MISTRRKPASPGSGVPWMVRVPVAWPCALRLLALRPAGKRVTVKYIPFPSLGLVGGVKRCVTGRGETFGKPLVVTVNERGDPVGNVAFFGMVIVGAS